MKRTILGIILIVLSIALILGWEFIGRDRLMYTEILTVNQDIEQGTEITKDMLATKKVTDPSPKSFRVVAEDVEKVIGMEATSYIPTGAELYSEYFEDPSLVLHTKTNEVYFPLPSSWIVAYPQTLRRGDTLIIYVEDGTRLLEATAIYVKDSSNAEVVSDNDRLKAAASVADIVIKVTEDQARLLTTTAADNTKFVLLYK